MGIDIVTQSNIVHTPRASFQIAPYSIKKKMNCTILEFKLSQVDYYSITPLSSHPKHGIGYDYGAMANLNNFICN